MNSRGKGEPFVKLLPSILSLWIQDALKVEFKGFPSLSKWNFFNISPVSPDPCYRPILQQSALKTQTCGILLSSFYVHFHLAKGHTSVLLLVSNLPRYPTTVLNPPPFYTHFGLFTQFYPVSFTQSVLPSQFYPVSFTQSTPPSIHRFQLVICKPSLSVLPSYGNLNPIHSPNPTCGTKASTPTSGYGSSSGTPQEILEKRSCTYQALSRNGQNKDQVLLSQQVQGIGKQGEGPL